MKMGPATSRAMNGPKKMVVHRAMATQTPSTTVARSTANSWRHMIDANRNSEVIGAPSIAGFKTGSHRYFIRVGSVYSHGPRPVIFNNWRWLRLRDFKLGRIRRAKHDGFEEEE
jgi:hypothetical protein